MLHYAIFFYFILIKFIYSELSLDLVEFTRYCENGNLFIKEHENKLLIKSQKNEILAFEPNSIEILSHLTYKNQITAESFLSHNVNQWFLHAIDTFQNKEEEYWTPHATSTCGTSGDFFLGGFCKLSFGEAIRYYNHLPNHTLVRITGRVHFIDKWTGQSIQFKADNEILWTESYNWCEEFAANCKNDGINVCGQQYPDRISVSLDVVFHHSQDSLMISFESTLPRGTDPCEISWGIDDIALYLLNKPTAEN